MKISTAVFASILSICIATSYVSGQIYFPDGTYQESAVGGNVSIKTGDAFRVTLVYEYGADLYTAPLQISDVVPAGQELVILQAVFGADELQVESRYPSPNENTDPEILFGFSGPESSTDSMNQDSTEFPNGAITVDEGRALWMNTRGTTNPNWTVYRFVTVIGYYRDKV